MVLRVSSVNEETRGIIAIVSDIKITLSTSTEVVYTSLAQCYSLTVQLFDSISSLARLVLERVFVYLYQSLVYIGKK